jgi:polyisoprenoid-binding protein YceI
MRVPDLRAVPLSPRNRKELREMTSIETANEQLLSNGSWSVDPAHSTLEFRVKHMMIQTVRGRFRDFDGVVIAGDEPSVHGTIKVASLETLNAERDAHLRSADFFDVERYPEISFCAGGLQFNGDGAHVSLPGELTIKGVKRPIALEGELSGGIIGNDHIRRIALSLRGELARSDYGLVWNRILETGGVLVGENVELTLDVSLYEAD